jgi:hypothetical protein
MAAVKLKFWAQPVDDTQVETYVTLTRYTDSANNSDKYRRFITFYDTTGANGTPYVLTQTGRWTYLTAAGNWSGGTVRTGGVVSHAAWRRNNQNHAAMHQAWVRAKKKDYTIDGSPLLTSWATARGLLSRAGLFDTPPLTTASTTGTQHMMTVPATADSTSNMEQMLTSLLSRSNDSAVDPFDLFADLAVLRTAVTERVEQLEQEALKLRDALVMCNDAIMRRI